MWEAYKIGVTLKLHNLVTPELTNISRDFKALDGLVTGLSANLAKTEARAATLMRTMARLPAMQAAYYGGSRGSSRSGSHGGNIHMNGVGVGVTGVSMGAGEYGMGSALAGFPVYNAIKNAAELQKELIGIQIATKGSNAEMDKMRATIEGISTQTIFSNVDVAKIGQLLATGVGGPILGASKIAELIPIYSRFADVQHLLKGADYKTSTNEAIRLAHTAGHYDPESLTKYLDMLNKVSFVVPGSLTEVGNALKYYQTTARTALGIEDESAITTIALLNRLGFSGSRGGTNALAAFMRSIPGMFGSGLLTGKSGKALKEMGMVDRGGHSTAFVDGKFDPLKFMEQNFEYVAKTMKADPLHGRESIAKHFQYAYGVQGARVASIFADPQAREQYDQIRESMLAGMNLMQAQKKFADESVWQKGINAGTNFKTLMTEIGYHSLPEANKGLTILNSNLSHAIEWARGNKDASKGLMLGLSGLSAVFAGGVLFKGLSFLTGASGLPGLAKGILLVGNAVTKAGLAVTGGYAAGAGARSLLETYVPSVMSSINRGVDSVMGATIDHWMGPKRGDLVAPRKYNQIPHGGGDVYLDGHKVGKVFDKQFAFNAQRGASGFDGNLSPVFPSMGHAR